MTFALEDKERTAILRGKRPQLVRSAQPEVAAGVVLTITQQVKITIRGAKRTKQGAWVVAYVLHDDRPRLLRSVPPMHEPGRRPNPHEDSDEASSYTTSPHGTVPSAGEAPPAEYDRVLATRAKTKRAELAQTERAIQLAREDARRLSAYMRDSLLALVRSGGDAALAVAKLHHAIAELQQNPPEQ